MEPGQVFLYILLLAFLGINVRRYLRRRSVPQVDPAAIPAGSLLLDVRTPAERSRESIPGSVHIPLHQLRMRAGELEKFRGRQIVCYCASGNRSLSAAAALKKLGFNAVNLVGGISNWKLARRA
jgi:rhodanese-related sulfurtransferase